MRVSLSFIYLQKAYKYNREGKNSLGFICFKKAAQRGNIHAQFLVGTILSTGKINPNTEKICNINKKVAALLYEQAAKHNHLQAINYLALMYEKGDGIEKNLKKAIELYTQGTLYNCAESHLGLGYVYCKLQDWSNAYKHYKLAAEKQNPNAMFCLARMYEKGQGVLRNSEKSLTWLKSSADMNFPPAQCSLGIIYLSNNVQEAERLLRLSSEKGYSEAQYNLGLMYYEGNGVAKNYQEALKLYRLAAAQGHLSALNNLGCMFKCGYGVDQDFREAYRLFSLTAAKGNAIGQYNLALLYADGQGVCKDAKEAVRLFRLAAEQGLAKAQNNLGCMFINGEGVIKDIEEAKRLYCLAAAQGDQEAQQNLENITK